MGHVILTEKDYIQNFKSPFTCNFNSQYMHTMFYLIKVSWSYVTDMTELCVIINLCPKTLHKLQI